LVSFRRLVASQLQTYWNQWPLCYPAACGGLGGVLTEEILRSRFQLAWLKKSRRTFTANLLGEYQEVTPSLGERLILFVVIYEIFRPSSATW
jgi:hypothetical protein